MVRQMLGLIHLMVIATAILRSAPALAQLPNELLCLGDDTKGGDPQFVPCSQLEQNEIAPEPCPPSNNEHAPSFNSPSSYEKIINWWNEKFGTRTPAILAKNALTKAQSRLMAKTWSHLFDSALRREQTKLSLSRSVAPNLVVWSLSGSIPAECAPTEPGWKSTFVSRASKTGPIPFYIKVLAIPSGGYQILISDSGFIALDSSVAGPQPDNAHIARTLSSKRPKLEADPEASAKPKKPLPTKYHSYLVSNLASRNKEIDVVEYWNGASDGSIRPTPTPVLDSRTPTPPAHEWIAQQAESLRSSRLAQLTRLLSRLQTAISHYRAAGELSRHMNSALTDQADKIIASLDQICH